MCRGASRRASRGFTLVEVVIALTLISLIFAALLAAMRTLGDSQERAQAVSARSDEMRLVSNFLRQHLESAVYLVRPPQAGGGLLFEGEAQRVLWVAPLYSVHAPGGLNLLELAMVQQGGSSDLVLRYVPWTDLGRLPEWNRSTEHRILSGIQQFEIGYQAEGHRDWVNAWHDVRVPPRRIRLLLKVADRYWPEIILTLAGQV